MKQACLILLFLACASACSTVDLDWEAFKAKFNKFYSVDEDVQRRKMFNENKLRILEHNKKYEEGKVTFKMGINKFADKFPEEMSYLKGYKGKKSTLRKAPIFNPQENITVPETVDWREQGYVTPVKDQGHCGSCWAFSATGSLEGQNFAKRGTLISLSEQNLVDCVDGEGCIKGGWMDDAFQYVKEAHGIDTEESYPYKAMDSYRCKFDPRDIGGTCSGYVDISSGSEDDLLSATATIGPISVAIDASQRSFNFYSEGVYYEPDCSTTSLDHGVLVVGYGNYNGQDYWLVKNSWGTGWGEDGYIMMSRNKDNNCGIATSASYPLA
ncbi:UNVERIFIED_CONTAM: hypothetical protein RMT77_017936 [Armadillidium vulgare]